MDLWIRSQNKNHLIKVNNIELNKTAIITKEKDVVLLGIYNETRALEILNDIQGIICLKDMYIYDKQEVHKSWEKLSKEQIRKVRQAIVVYEMPKE